MTILLKMPFGDYTDSIKQIFANGYPKYIINQRKFYRSKIGNELKSSARNAIFIFAIN